MIIAALGAAVCLLGGCDFFRVLAHRPTSREIEAKRVRIEQELARSRVRQDSLALARQHVSDSLAADSLQRSEALRLAQQAYEDSLQRASQKLPAQYKARTIPSRSLSRTERGTLTHRYYLMIGAFSKRENAERQAARAEKAGYPATLINFQSGMTAVGVSPTDDLNVAWATLDRLRHESFCPQDAWILNNE